MTRSVNSLLKKGNKIKHTKNDAIDIWCRYINYFKFEVGERHFDFSIITDGSAFGVKLMVDCDAQCNVGGKVTEKLTKYKAKSFH